MDSKSLRVQIRIQTEMSAGEIGDERNKFVDE